MAEDLVPATNWAGNVTFRAARKERPADLDALRRIVSTSRRVRVLGTGHSFNRVADTEGVLVSLAGLPRAIDINHDRRVVEIAGQWTYGELARELERSALALPNTGSLPHISVAGACSTGTHGSGIGNQTLAASACAATVLTAAGDLVTVDRKDRDFGGWVLALGRVGVVLGLTLDVVPTFRIAQTVVERVPDEQVATSLASIMAAAYSVSLFTNWGPREESQVWLKEFAGRSIAGERWGGTEAEVPHNPVAGMPPENATDQLGRPGPWHERLPHFRLEFTPSSGDELQTEYLVPMTHATAAWKAVDAIRDVLHPLLHVCEFRAVAPDPMWLSLTGGRLSLAVHFTWRPDDAVTEAVAAVEEQLLPYDARPHWGKVFSVTPAQLERLYPRMADFRRLVDEVDPDGIFGNDQVDGWIGLDHRH